MNEARRTEAVKIEKDKTLVYVPDGEKSKPVPVRIGLDNGVKAEVLDGLQENAEVYVTHTSMPENNQNRNRRGLRF